MEERAPPLRPGPRLGLARRRAEFGFLEFRILARAIPNHRIAVFVRINLVEVNLRLRHGFGPRRISFGPWRLVVHLRDRFAVVEPILLVGPIEGRGRKRSENFR